MKRPHFVRFGPAIPVIPVGDFSKTALSDEQWAQLWSIVGPSVEKNMAQGFRHRQLELWQVIAAAYMEGLVHGYGIGQENHNKPSGESVRLSRDVRPSKRTREDYCWDGIPCG
jgi:hypothetical protein